MADSLRMNNSFEVSGPIRTLCIVSNHFAQTYIEAFRTICSQDVVTATDVEEGLRVLKQGNARHVIWPVAGRDPTGHHSLDNACRAANAAYLPITLTADALEVGPLLASGRSCAGCWENRLLQQGQNSLDRHVRDSARFIQNYYASCAVMAAALTPNILALRSSPFRSPIWKLNLSHNYAVWGDLISTSGCDLCVKEFRKSRDPLTDLTQVIQSLKMDDCEAISN
jgi:hypothetical protein